MFGLVAARLSHAASALEARHLLPAPGPGLHHPTSPASRSVATAPRRGASPQAASLNSGRPPTPQCRH